MASRVLDDIDSEHLAVYVVWVPRLGATESRVSEATTLLLDPRGRHYWDPDETLGADYRDRLDLRIDRPAWDIYFLYGAGVEWMDDGVPLPSYWQHQLSGVTHGQRLDGAAFADRVREQLSEAGLAQ